MNKGDESGPELRSRVVQETKRVTVRSDASTALRSVLSRAITEEKENRGSLSGDHVPGHAVCAFAAASSSKGLREGMW